MTKEAIQRKRNIYVENGKKALAEASAYMSANADVWNENHIDYWKSFLYKAEAALNGAQALTELLSDDN